MTESTWTIVAAAAAGGAGLALLLPGGRRRTGPLGIALALVGAGLFGWQLPRLAGLAEQGTLFALSGLTVVSCAAAVTVRNPLYTAIWFGASLIGTAGLFLLAGAQFLAAATIVVYAGAILVTFLFVLMLAQPRGNASYDRLSWGRFLAAAAAAAVTGMLAGSITDHLGRAGAEAATAAERSASILAPDPVARLGSQLFSQHLVSVQVVGLLLLAALVGAVAIVEQARPRGGG